MRSGRFRPRFRSPPAPLALILGGRLTLHLPTRSSAAHAGEILLLAALYVVVARFGLAMDAVSGFATLVWPPTGIALAALVLFGMRLWPAILLGAFVVNAWRGAPIPVALAIGVGNVLEAVAGAWALRRLARFHPALERQRDVLALIALAAIWSTAISASIGTASLVAGGVIPSAKAGTTWIAWWLGDMGGDLVVAPLLLTAAVMDTIRRRWAEAAALVLALAIIGWFVFGAWHPEVARPLRHHYMLWPLLMWAAIRFNTPGAARATFIASAIAVWGTAAGHGPFVRERLAMSLMSLQVFVSVSAATFLLLGAASAERKRAGAEREQLIRDLEAAISVRDDFLSVAAHELKTPIAPVRLLGQTLLRGIRRGDPEARDSEWLSARLDAIERAMQRLETLIDQLLDVTRLAGGHLVLTREPVDLAASVRDVVQRLDGVASRVSVAIPPGESVVGRWDRLRIEQLVGNLISNAVKYGEGRPVEVTVHRDERTARLAVRDQGIGIAAEEHGRIFEKFARAAPLRHYAGFGLGLWIAREIAIAHGGTIRLDSEPGAGALFTVELPLEAPSAG